MYIQQPIYNVPTLTPYLKIPPNLDEWRRKDESWYSLDIEAQSEAQKKKRNLSHNSSILSMAFPSKIQMFLLCNVTQNSAATALLQRDFAFIPLPKAKEFSIRRQSQEPRMTHNILASLHNPFHNFEAINKWRRWLEISALFLHNTHRDWEWQVLGNFLCFLQKKKKKRKLSLDHFCSIHFSLCQSPQENLNFRRYPSKSFWRIKLFFNMLENNHLHFASLFWWIFEINMQI